MSDAKPILNVLDLVVRDMDASVAFYRLLGLEAVDQTFAKVTASGPPGVQPPYDTFWGPRYAVVEESRREPRRRDEPARSCAREGAASDLMNGRGGGRGGRARHHHDAGLMARS